MIPPGGFGKIHIPASLEEALLVKRKTQCSNRLKRLKQLANPKGPAPGKRRPSLSHRPETHQEVGTNSQRSSPRNTLHSDVLWEQGKKHVQGSEQPGYATEKAQSLCQREPCCQSSRLCWAPAGCQTAAHPSPLLTRPLLKASLFSPRASSADARVKSASPAMGKYSLSIFLDAIMASAWEGGHTVSKEGKGWLQPPR